MIPFLDLQRQWRDLAPELEPVVLDTLRSGAWVQGPAVAEFERNFAAFCGTRHAVAVGSGTWALHLALLALDIGPGDEVITVPATFVATVAAILYTGARPVLVDVDARTLTMDPARLQEAIGPRTRAILPVHLHGQLADITKICAIAKAAGVPVIEDAAQAHGARRYGGRAGSFGKLGCFSFYPGKNLGACGEGGAVVTNDAKLAARVRSLADWGQEGKGNHVLAGYNARLDTVQAAILDVKLRHLEDWTAARRRVAARYSAGLDPAIDAPIGPFGEDHACHVFAIRVPDRDTLRARLAEAGVPTGIHYAVPVHLQPAYAGLGYGPGAFPISEANARMTLSLPIYPDISEADLTRVILSVNRLARQGGHSKDVASAMQA